MNNKLKKIIFDLIDTKTKGVDTYHHNGSMWLIFTDQKKWVIEFTKQGTLWYNFNFFQQFFRYLSLDVIENQHYITEWVEAILKNGVGYTSPTGEWEPVRVEDTIQNGVRSTDSWAGKPFVSVESIIQNGVKETRSGCDLLIDDSIEGVIRNGVKYTRLVKNKNQTFVEDTIQNGVKETFLVKGTRIGIVENTIQIGVKHTEYGDWEDGDERFDDIIQNGVKETWGYEKQPQKRIDEVIMNGQKD